MISQPAIQMDFLHKGTEPVIGQNEEAMFSIPVRHLLLHLTDKTIELLVPFLGNVGPLTEKHMLDAVKAIKDTRQNTFTKVLHQIEKDLLAPLEDHLAQIQKLLVCDTAFLKARRILRPAKG